MFASGGTFVARARQLSRLEELLEHALAGQGQVCFVVGEAGSGKSTLIQEFTRRSQARNDELLVVFGDCNAQTGAGDPYLPFREILAQLAGDVDRSVAEGAITAENARRLRDFLEVSGDVLVDVGADVLGIFVPGASLLAHMGKRLLGRKDADGTTPNLGPKEVLEQYTDILRRLAEKQPLIVLLDDLHWADSASVDLLFHLARRIEGSRVLVIGTYRPQDVSLGRHGDRHPLEPALAELKRYYGDTWIDLERHDADEPGGFVDALIDSRPNRLDASFRRALLLHTEGNALFTVELLRSFQEQGILVRDAEDRWVLAGPLEWGRLPSRVEGVIEGRIGRLDAGLRQLLTVASVEGETFTAQVLARVDATEERDVIRRLSGELEKQHQLVMAQNVERIDGRRVSRYRFRHALFQKYLYDALDEVERAHLHEDVGRVLEELYEGQTRRIATRLARHFAEAGDDGRAVNYLEQAGDDAAAVHAFGEARLHYVHALERMGGLPDSVDQRRRRVDMTVRLARVSYLGASPAQNLAYLAAAATIATALVAEHGTAGGDRRLLAHVHFWMGRYHFLLNAPAEAIGYYRKVLEVAAELEDEELLALPSSVIGRALVSQGHFDRAVPLLTQALEPLERTGNVLEWIHTLSFLGSALAGLGDYAGGLAAVERGLARARDIQSPTALSLCHIHLWGAHMHARDAAAMLAVARTMVESAEGAGDPVALYVGLGFLGWSHLANGSPAEAEASMERCRSVAGQLGTRLVIADWFAALDAEIALAQGRLEDAGDFADGAVALARSIGGVFAETRAERVRAIVAGRSGQWAKAEAHFAASLAAAESGGERPEIARTHAAWGELCEERGESACAREHYRAAVRILDEGATALDLEGLRRRLAELPDP